MSRHPFAPLGFVVVLLVSVGPCPLASGQETQAAQSHDQDREKIGAFVQKGDWKAAKAIAEAWLNDEPNAALALFVEDAAGLMTKTRKNPCRSTADFPYADKEASDSLVAWTQDLMVADPKNANYLMLNGMLYVLGKRDFERALERFEKVLDSQPDNVFALAWCGAGYGAKNRLDDAIRVSEKAIKLDPDSADAYSNMGMVQMTRGDREKAETYFKKAVACTNAGAMDWFNLGSLQLAQGRTQDAKASLLKAVEISPNYYPPHWNLASIYYSLGMKSDCIRECKKVLELAPDSVEGQKAKRNLQALGE